jgi:hypothetical protein
MATRFMVIVPLAVGWNAHTLFITMPYTGKAHKIASNSALSERQYSDGFRYGKEPLAPHERFLTAFFSGVDVRLRRAFQRCSSHAAAQRISGATRC